MLRVLSITVFPAILLTLGILNWATTCCCGNSMILEIMHGSCEHHEEDHHENDVPTGNPHPCHKQGEGAFLVAADPEIPHSPAVATITDDSTPVVSWTLGPVVADWTMPRCAPPDIPVLTQRLLI